MWRREQWLSLWQEFIAGESLPPAPKPRTWLGREEGMVSLVSIVAVLFFAVLLGLVVNVGYTTRQKIETQNAADSLAYSAGLWQARGLNAVTAANHVLGELTAVCVLQFALGGPELDKGDEFSTSETNRMKTTLTVARNLARISDMGKQDIAVVADNDIINFKHKAGATLYDSRLTLQYFLFWAYAGHIISFPIEKFPPTAAIGEALDALCLAFREVIGVQWKTLDVIEQAASATRPLRQALEQGVIPAVYQFSQSVPGQTQSALGQSVTQLSQFHGVSGTLYPAPDKIKLPLEKEEAPKRGSGGLPPSSDVSVPAVDFLNFIGSSLLGVPAAPPAPGSDGYPANPSRKSLIGIQGDTANWGQEQTSQWNRATYPFVNAWRAPIRGLGDSPLLFISHFSAWYNHWTDRCCLSKSYEMRKQRLMFVLIQTKQYGHGRQAWTTAGGSRQADRYFTVMGLAQRPSKTLASPGFFGQIHRDGIVAYAQAMTYNANRENLANPGPQGGFQPELGWNTLNWKPPVSQSGAYEFSNGAHSEGMDLSSLVGMLSGTPSASSRPVIQLNWQCKLTPVTRVQEAANSSDLDGRYRSVLQKLIDAPQFRTH